MTETWGRAGRGGFFETLEKVQDRNVEDFTGFVQAQRSDGCFPVLCKLDCVGGQAKGVGQIELGDVLALALLFKPLPNDLIDPMKGTG